MIKSRKAIMVEALMRIVIMVVLVVIVFNIGKKVAEAAFGGSDALQSVENLVNEINSLEEGKKQALVSLDEGTAVIGFSKNTKEFRCHVCQTVYGQAYSGLYYYSINKPSNPECSDKACACLCMKELTIDQSSGTERKINCGQFSCRTLNKDIDIVAKITLEDALRKRGVNIATFPYWENGFFFVRRKNPSTPLNGMPPNDARKITLFIEKKRLNQELYVGVCPSLPCIQEQK